MQTHVLSRPWPFLLSFCLIVPALGVACGNVTGKAGDAGASAADAGSGSPGRNTGGGLLPDGGPSSTGGQGTAGGQGSPGGQSSTGGATSGTGSTTGTVIPGITTPTGGACIAADPVVTVTTPSGSYATCTGAIAETRFLNALCTCGDATQKGNITVNSIDSDYSSTAKVGGGSIGVNQGFFLAGNATVGGSLTLAGTDAVEQHGNIDVGGNYSVQGAVSEFGNTQVNGNAYLGSKYRVAGDFTVMGNVYATNAITRDPPAKVKISGQTVNESVSVAAPCPCKDSDFLDIPALVDEAKASNDDAAAGVDPNALADLHSGVSLTLICGKYFLSSISGLTAAAGATLNVKGPVSLFIDDSIALAGNLTINLDPLASIDIFIRNSITINGNSSFGSTDRPAATRIYVGKGDVTIRGNGNFVGNVYAPHSKILLPGNFVVFGSLFANNFENPGNTTLVYDKSIQRAGQKCGQTPPPVGVCSQCGTCTGGTACVGGVCGACTKDSDCCSPLTCQDGKCGEYVTIVF